MFEITRESDRQVIPRWRSYVSSLNFGELKSLRDDRGHAIPLSALNDLIEDWHRQKSLSVACDLFSAAYSCGHTELAIDVANFILTYDRVPRHVRDLAERTISGTQNELSDSLSGQYGDAKSDHLDPVVHDLRDRLREYPRNPILWTNLALAYTVAGSQEKAERAIRVALSMSPENRFVARSACRFFLHTGDPERAHAVLSRLAAVRHDPWLLSSEIAVSAVRHKSSNLIRTARKMIESRSLSKFHLSEVSSAIATIEAHSGHIKKARILSSFSMAEPAENAIAQISWLSRHCGIAFPTAPESSIASHEADAWTDVNSRNWRSAIENAKCWQLEQPFSSRPAMLGGSIANNALEDYPLAESFLKSAFRSNSDDPVLINNLAFSLAKQNKLKEAFETISHIRSGNLEERAVICITATKGLILYRAGEQMVGRSLYQAAISSAEAGGHKDLVAIAKCVLAVELMESKARDYRHFYDDAMNSVELLTEPSLTIYKNKLAESIKKMFEE